MTVNSATDSAEPAYLFRPSLLGAPWSLRLTANGIAWERGRHSGWLDYGDVTRVRLSFKPAPMQNQRFMCELWGPGGPKLLLVSTSWKSMTQQERLDADYVRFVRELHRRLQSSHATAIYETGVAPAIFWVGFAVYALVGLALAGLIVRSLQAGAWNGAAIVAVFLGLFLLNGRYFQRNKPGHYRPDALPETLLPASVSATPPPASSG